MTGHNSKRSSSLRYVLHSKEKSGMTICRIARAAAMATVAAAIAGCSPEVGSEDWCDDMKEKPKGEWTVNMAKDFAKYCILR